MKKILTIIILIGTVVGAYYLFQNYKKDKTSAENNNEQTITTNKQTTTTNEEIINNNFEIQGMKVEILKEGTGNEAKIGDTVSVNYVGTFEDGKKFDSSIDRGVPFSFTLGAGTIIKGWDLGVVGMKVGEKRKLIIPSDLAYGERGNGPILPNTTLVFEIDLLNIN